MRSLPCNNPRVDGHEGHSHAVKPDADVRRLWIALGLIAGFMAAEVVVGILADSLALLSDAAHMLTDAGALVLSLVVIRLVKRPAGGNLTFGLKRTEILSAQANGGTLLVLACLIVYEGIRRLIDPPDAQGTGDPDRRPRRDRREPRRDVAAREGEPRVDEHRGLVPAPAHRRRRVRPDRGRRRRHPRDRLDARGRCRVARSIAGIMLVAAYGLLRDSGRVLLEAAPEGTSVEEIGAALAAHPHVASVHDLHVWLVSSDLPALSAHVLVHPGDDCHAIRRELEVLLHDRFAITHTTLQVDHADSRRLLSISGSSDPGR